jgi:hypothetical protein
MFRIETGNGYTGINAIGPNNADRTAPPGEHGTAFISGVGYTDSPGAAQFAERQGWAVTEVDGQPDAHKAAESLLRDGDLRAAVEAFLQAVTA